jgi:hypothetical protein
VAKESPPESLGHGKVLKASDKALEIELTELGETRWIPRSVIHDDSDVYDDEDHNDGEVVVHQWWAIKNELV